MNLDMDARNKKIEGKKPQQFSIFDSREGDLIVRVKDHIGYRYEVIKKIGSGTFGQVYQCKDHKNGETVALKILKNEKDFNE